MEMIRYPYTYQAVPSVTTCFSHVGVEAVRDPETTHGPITQPYEAAA